MKGVVDENNDLLKNKKSNIVVRMLFDKLKEKNIQDSCYPEQFDCTFSFVPRMCDSRSDIDNCNICPFKVNNITKAAPINELFCLIDKEDDDYYPYKDDDEEFYDFVRVRNKYCPFLLYSCGYKAKCKDLKNCPNKVFAPINYSLKLELIRMLECYNTSRIMKYENHSEVIIHYCIFEHKDNANDQIEFWVMLHKNLKMDMGLCTYRKRRKLERDESDDDLIRDSKDYVYEYGNVPISRYLLKSNHEDDFHRITEALQFTEDVNCKDLYIHKLPDVKGEEQLKEEIMPIISETFSKLLEMCRELNMYT